MEQAFNGIDFLAAVILKLLFLYVLFANEIHLLHKVYLGFHIAMMLWPIGMFAMSMTPDPNYQWYCLNLSFLGLCCTGYGWLMFSMMLTKGLHRIRKAGYLYIALPALIIAVLITLNPLHGLFATTDSEWVRERTYGIVFYFLVFVSVLYVILGCTLMIRALVRTPNAAFKRQIALFLFGQSIMLLLSLTDAAQAVGALSPDFPLKAGLTSFGIVISDVCFVIAIRNNNAFRIISIALREVVDSMDTGMAVIDDRHTVLDCNAAAKRFFPLEIGKPFPIEALLEGALEPDFGREFLQSYLYNKGKMLRTEVIVKEPQTMNVLVKIAPIFTVNGTYAGRIITMHDVTEWRRLVHELNDRNEVLAVRNNELTLMQKELSLANQKLEMLATTDPLTGCYNRRYLNQMLEYQIAVEQRYGMSFSLLLFDVDYFKQINDTYGHHVGDEVLRHTANVIRKRLRESDILARYGGEEFAIYLPHTGKKDALKLAEQLRILVESHVIHTEHGDIRITISMGLISVEGPRSENVSPKEFLAELMRQADRALYRAKQEGRNRVVAT